MLYLLLLSAVAASQPNPITLGDQDLIITLSKHADAICPMLIDQSIPDKERGERLVRFAKEQGYRGSRLTLLGMICTQWQKGFVAGARQGPIN